MNKLLIWGVACKLSVEEIKSYNGPVFYLGHPDVNKPGSISTPCRIVFNSSAKFLNHSLNDYWVKGQDLINNLLGVVLRFREWKIGFSADISKMHHTIKLSEMDQHIHQFLWRDMNWYKQLEIYVITSVSFRDKPASWCNCYISP